MRIEAMGNSRKEYSAGAVKLSFWFTEFRQVFPLLGEGKKLS
jgi:hypothetical protein